MPGLADMHVHYWDPGEAALFLANGVTHVRNLSGAPLQLAMQRKVARRELLGPHLITTTPLVDGIEVRGSSERVREWAINAWDAFVELPRPHAAACQLRNQRPAPCG